jgi:exopolysaccharide biosynthesis polyprenyl glycosylphosphotransferase
MSVVAASAMIDARDMAEGTDIGSPSRSLRYALFAIDTAAVASSWLIAESLFPVEPRTVAGIGSRLLVVTAVSLFLLASQRLYRARVCTVRYAEVVRLLRVAGGAAVFFMVWRGGITTDHSVVSTAVVGGALSFAFLAGCRGFYDAWLRAERAGGRFTRQVVVVGQGRDAERVIELLRYHPELGYRICGLVGDLDTAEKHDLPWLGGPRNAVKEVLASGASGAVLVSAGMPSDEVSHILRDLLGAGLHIQVSAGLWQVDQRRLQAAPLAHEPFFYLEPPALSAWQLRLKRALDLFVACLILVLSAPLLLVCSLAVKLSDGGPVLFRQTRIGRDGHAFTLLKLRTMVVDAEARLAGLRGDNQRTGPLFKLDSDPRVTRIGKFLRATSLDELPQLFNVVAGSMSMVGPRPALPSEVAAFDADLLVRHQVAPGITGLWQLEARENASFYAYRHLDLFYVENWSCALDLVILAGTVPALAARSIRSVIGRTAIAGEMA